MTTKKKTRGARGAAASPTAAKPSHDGAASGPLPRSPAEPPSSGLSLDNYGLPVGLMPPEFTPEYVANVVKPFFLSGRFTGETPALPMIDLALSKERAIPAHLWGLFYDDWLPKPEEGTSVFISGYDKRGPDNERKRIYMTAVTPDLIATKYLGKLGSFFDRLLARTNAGKPLMYEFYANYDDLYWDLHLGVTGDAIPRDVRQCRESFNAVIGYMYPTLDVVRENYMRVRQTRPVLRSWVDERVHAIQDGKVANADRTLVYYWLRNRGLGESFPLQDVVFECFHNFLALSQWGNTTYQVLGRLASGTGDARVRACFERTMMGKPDEKDGGAFTPLDRLVMELFRTISPNRGSSSTVERQHDLLGGLFTLANTPHLRSSMDPTHWDDPTSFDPDRYLRVATTVDNDPAKCAKAGLARCPFHETSFAAKDGRDVQMENSGFGAVYAVEGGEPKPLADAPGYAPFGFGYRRCAGEYLTVEFVKELLRRVWSGNLTIIRLDLANPQKLPVGPGTVIEDDLGFR